VPPWKGNWIRVSRNDLRRRPFPIINCCGCIGRGAYGDVWLAQNALGTLRAVKVVYHARFDDDRPYEREFNGILKYEPISRTHEGLVQVLHAGRNDEVRCFYYVMELADAVSALEPPELNSPVAKSKDVQGNDVKNYVPRTLRNDLRSHRLCPVDAALLTVRLVSALAHLHSHLAMKFHEIKDLQSPRIHSRPLSSPGRLKSCRHARPVSQPRSRLESHHSQRQRTARLERFQ